MENSPFSFWRGSTVSWASIYVIFMESIMYNPNTCHSMMSHHGMWQRAVRAHCHPSLLTAPSWFQGESCIILPFPGAIFSPTVPSLATVVHTDKQILSAYMEESNEKILVLFVTFLRLNWWVTSSTCDTNLAISSTWWPPQARSVLAAVEALQREDFQGYYCRADCLALSEGLPTALSRWEPPSHLVLH